MFKVRVNFSQKALIYKDEKLIKVLDSGVYKLFNPFRKYRIEYIDKGRLGIEGLEAKLLYKNFTDVIKKNFSVIDLNESQRAFVKVDGKFTEVLPPNSTKLYFKELNVEAQIVDIKKSYELTKEQISYIDSLKSNPIYIMRVYIPQGANGYLFVDEKYTKMLDSGVYYYFNELNNIEVKVVNKQLQELEVNQQELLTNDKVTIRLNALMHYKISDGLKYISAVDDAKEYIYKQLQFAIREHIGSLTIDSILIRQHTLTSEIIVKLKELLISVGVELVGVHIKDIILPGEMREIFNQVIEAQKRAEANIIKRREETAATRSLLNTAKLMRDNPTLARLKELEAIEKITQSVQTLNVYGGLEGVMSDLVKLR